MDKVYNDVCVECGDTLGVHRLFSNNKDGSGFLVCGIECLNKHKEQKPMVTGQLEYLENNPKKEDHLYYLKD